MLIDAGVVTAGDVREALELQQQEPCRLGSLLVRLGRCTHDQVREVLRTQMGLPVIELGSFPVLPAALDLLSPEMIIRSEVLPLTANGDTLTVAMVDPMNLATIDDVRFATGYRSVRVVCITEEDFDAFIGEHVSSRPILAEIMETSELYDRAISAVDGFKAESPDEAPDTVSSDLRAAGEQPPIVTLCNYVLVQALQRGASDVHIEPYETYFRVRLRVDGMLHQALTPPRRLCAAMISRMKILAGMDISQRREPQDGALSLNYEGETVHFRVSTLPTVYGEKCVIRLMKKDARLHSLATLGFSESDLERLARVFREPQGLVLVTGPTGSGKTTTLHAALGDINAAEVNIVTLEDPVEASIAGINHVDVGDGKGVSFASGLRSILRQDPDVVFVGEMRDPEVASIAVKASLTGHLVLSTLHTNSAAASLTRLADMRLASYLIADALLLVIAQRLVRRVCSSCAIPYEPYAEELAEFDLIPPRLAGAHLQVGTGCEACFDSGYSGRVAVYELLEIDAAIAAHIRAGASAEEVMVSARRNGMTTLREAGIERALAGETTLAEVRRSLGSGGRG